MKIYGDQIDQQTLAQMEAATKLPIARKAALMPDAHLGYGLPIGGVLATEGAVIPYGVGVDIACRMRLSIVDSWVSHAKQIESIVENTKFGPGQEWSPINEHPVMEDPRWYDSDILYDLRPKAWRQLGTSGGGNHFVEWGMVALSESYGSLSPGQYIGLLSHSGSRGAGAAVCHHFTRLAKEQNPAGELSWLDLDSQDGRDYWTAMNLMGDYAAANHEVIHRRVLAHAEVEAAEVVENHHNFAWEEDGLIVHRKGATPAGEGVYGVIPGNMVDPGYIVRGKGKADSVNSASHGAGRKLSRSQAKKTFNKQEWEQYLQKMGVTLLGGGLDEMPGAYKNIEEVMESQQDLVETVGYFVPLVVRME